MARYTFKIVDVAKISKKMPWNYRYRLQDAALKASVARSGVLMPLIVTGGESSSLISGYRRLAAARECGLREVPALEAGALSFRDAFILNLVSNWRQGCSEMDRAKAIALATRELAFSDADLRDLVMPLLGLSADGTVLELYRKVHDFPPALKDFFEDGVMPFRGAAYLVQLSKANQEFFAAETGKQVKFTSSQLLQTGEWLVDLVRGTGKDLETLFREHKLTESLHRPGMDPRTRADKLFERIKKLRFPGHTVYLEAFDERVAPILREAGNLRVRPVDGFEERGFEILARMKTPADLDVLLKKLSQERSALNSLFDVML